MTSLSYLNETVPISQNVISTPPQTIKGNGVFPAIFDANYLKTTPKSHFLLIWKKK